MLALLATGAGLENEGPLPGPSEAAPDKVAFPLPAPGGGLTDAAALPPLAESRPPSAAQADETIDGASWGEATDRRPLPQVTSAALSLDGCHVVGPTQPFLCVYLC